METTLITKQELESLSIEQLRKDASSIGIKNYIKFQKEELIDEILKFQEKSSKIQELDSLMDKVISKNDTKLYTDVMDILGGNYDSDLDELLEIADLKDIEEGVETIKEYFKLESVNPYKLINEVNDVRNKPHEIKVNKTKKSDIFYIDPLLIQIEEGFNTRIEYNIDELTESVIENGVRVPMRGYKEGEKYILTDGHRRLMAVKSALEKGIDIARVPFISEKKKSLEERIFDIIIFNDGKKLTPLELGETYKRLIDYGYNYSEIAKKIGKSLKHVSEMVDVASSSKEVKKIIESGNISASLVAEVRKKAKDNNEAEEMIKTVSSIKKESSGGVTKKEKVTKKDIEDLLPNYQKSYTPKEVRSLLKKQVQACIDILPEESKELLSGVEILIK